MKKLPIARTDSIVVQTLGKEILIYDLNVHKAFNLNETSAIVYQACDGKTAFDEFKVKNKFSDELIFLALDELSRLDLLEKDQGFSSPLKKLSRREAIRRVGLASMIALPVISALAAPTSASAQSCIPGGGACNLADPGACCSNTCVNGSPTPTCTSAGCIADGGACSLADPGACCSSVCVNGSPTPACKCLPSGSACSLADPAKCCSSTCINNGPTQTCL